MNGSPSMVTGTVIDRFKVLKPLGAGGFGEVYLAIGLDDSRDVAIKVLRKERADYVALLERFKKEAELYKSIAHPGVVALLGEGETDTFHYIALEHIRGMSLRRKLNQEGPAGLVTSYGWLYDLVLALHAAHQKGVVHGDIKPENIMITQNLEVKLIDFGIARSGEGPRSDDPSSLVEPVTDSGALCTIRYASPEQLLGRPVDFRTDIFSLGLVFFEMLTGTAMFRDLRTAKEILLKHMALESGKKRLLPVRDGDDGVILDGCEELLRSMLRFDPERRCGSTVELASRMQSFADRVGGALLVASGDEARLLAQRELADTHYWKALALLNECRVFEAVEELKLVTAFSCSVENTAVQTLLKELDLLSVKMGKGCGSCGSNCVLTDLSEYSAILSKVVDTYAVICSGLETALRERMVCELARKRLDTSGFERFLQEQCVRRPYSHVFASVYVRHLHECSPEIACRIWNRLFDDLVRRKLLPQAVREKKKIERTFGGRILTAEALDGFGRLVEKEERELGGFLAAYEALKKMEDPGTLVELCRNFLVEHPWSIPVLERLHAGLVALERSHDALDALFQMGAAQFVGGYLGRAMGTFREVLEGNPNDERAVMALFTCHLVDGGECPLGIATYKGIEQFVHRRFDILAPMVRRLESRLSGADSDLAVYDEIVKLLLRKKKLQQAAEYLVRHGARLLSSGRSKEAHELFEKALDVAPVSEAVYGQMMSVPGIRRLYNPMELSRRASRGRAGAGTSLFDLKSLRD